MCCFEWAVGVACEYVVGGPWVGAIGSFAADVAGDGGCADVCCFEFVLGSVEGWSFMYFAVDSAQVESAAVHAWDREAPRLTGVAAAHVAP